jgi:hypothetical protein
MRRLAALIQPAAAAPADDRFTAANLGNWMFGWGRLPVYANSG